MDTDLDKRFMREALKMARKAYEADEVPVGAVIIRRNALLAKAHNQIELLKDPTAHAEMLAITSAADALGQKWLHGCTLYVTIEPCSMCAGALVLSRLDRLVFGAQDPKTGACGSVLNIVEHGKLNHTLQVEKGVLADECSLLMSEFFKNKRSLSSN